MLKSTQSIHISLSDTPDGDVEAGEIRESLSSVVRVGPHLFLGCDETATLERVTDQGGGRFGEHRTYLLSELLDLPAGEDEVDVEGLAWDPPYLWVAGSHSRKRGKVGKEMDYDEASEELADVDVEENRYLVARIPLEMDMGQGGLVPRRKCPDPEDPDRTLTAARLKGSGRKSVLMRAMEDDPHLHRFRKIPGKDNGLDIEGLAVRDGRVFLGLRGPVLRGWAVVLELHPKESSGAGRLKLKKVDDDGARIRKHFLDLDGLGVRELTQDGDDLLVLAGPTMDVRAAAAVFRWRGGLTVREPALVRGDDLRRIAELPHDVDGGEDHPEGMCRFDVEDEDRCVLVVYDSAGPRLRERGGVRGDVFSLPAPRLSLGQLAGRVLTALPGGTGGDGGE